jgi:trimethylamine-N-oxide reductase cytochrome c-type subunit TorC
MTQGVVSPPLLLSDATRRRRGWLGLLAAAAAFAAGILFWGGFNTVLEATNSLGFCTSCHAMRTTVYEEYRHTRHYSNRTGVRAICSDCHVPKDWPGMLARKVLATRELLAWARGTIDTREKFEAQRGDLAQRVWSTMAANNSRECRNCHDAANMAPERQGRFAAQRHANVAAAGQTCIDCHRGIAHRLPDMSGVPGWQ